MFLKKRALLITALVLSLALLPGKAEETFFRQLEARDNMVIVKDGWKYGLKKSDGSEVVPCVYEEIIPVDGGVKGLFFVLSVGGMYGMADEYGNMLLPVKYTYIVPKLYGYKVLVQQEGIKVTESTYELSLSSKDPYNLYIGSGDSQTTARFFEMTPFEWTPYARRFAINGKWGLADVRPNVSMILPSYTVVSPSPDNDRYLLMGYTYADEYAYNIYDTEKETFLLAIDEKVPYSSLYLLKGNCFLLNGYLRSFDAPTVNLTKTVYSFIVDLNENYLLCQSGKTPCLLDKKTGTTVTEAKKITYFKTSDKPTGDFALGEGKTWVLYSGGNRYVAKSGEYFFMGGYPVLVEGEEATVVIQGVPTFKTKKNFFSVAEDGMSIVYINADGNLVMLEYPGMTEKLLQKDCTGFQSYNSDLNCITVKCMQDGKEKAGLMDIATGKILEPYCHDDARSFYGDYFLAQDGDLLYMRRFSNPSFSRKIKNFVYNEYTKKPLCWISETGESDSYALYSMANDSLLTDFSYSGMQLSRFPGRMLLLGYDFVPFMQNSMVGIMDTAGRVAVKPKYSKSAFLFNEGFCLVGIRTGNDNRFGSVNPFTGVEIPCIYEDMGSFTNGRCFIKDNGLWGMVDNNGKVIVPARYKSITDFHADLDWLRKDHFANGLTYGVKDDSKAPATVEWFDRDGKIICEGTASVPLVQTVIPDELWDF